LDRKILADLRAIRGIKKDGQCCFFAHNRGNNINLCT
jgi:hypothetical protein